MGRGHNVIIEDLVVAAPPLEFVRWSPESGLDVTNPYDVFLMHKKESLVVRITFTSSNMQSIEEIGIKDGRGHIWITAQPHERTFQVFVPSTAGGVGDLDMVSDTDRDGYQDEVRYWTGARLLTRHMICSETDEAKKEQ